MARSPHPAPLARRRRPYSAHYRRLRVVAAVTALLQAVTLAGHLSLSNRVRQASAQDVNFSLTISSPTSETAATPTPTPTPGGGGGGPPTPLPPQQRPDPFVPGESNVAPYVYVGMFDGVPISPGEVGATYARNPTFTGKTNLAGAVVFLELDAAPARLYTVHATPGGVWEFTAPVQLPVGWHSLAMTAVSPYAPELRAAAIFQFQVVPIPPFPLTPTASPRPSVSPGATEAQPPREAEPREVPRVEPPASPPPAVVPPAAALYDLRVEVPPQSQVLQRGQPLEVITRVAPLVQPLAGEEVALLTYRIIDDHGRTVLSQEQSVLLGKPLAYPLRQQLPWSLPPGEYRVVAELPRGSLTYVALDAFKVATPTVALLPGIVVPTAAASDVLLRLSYSLALMLLTFLAMLIIEHRRAMRAPQVTEQDLWRDGEIR